jgi:hypothetical protein
MQIDGVKIFLMRISRREALDSWYRLLNSLHPIIFGDRGFFELSSSELPDCSSIAIHHLVIRSWLWLPSIKQADELIKS